MKEPKDVKISFRLTNSDYEILLKIKENIIKETGNTKITVTDVITTCLHEMIGGIAISGGDV